MQEEPPENKWFIGRKIILFNPDSLYPLTHQCGAWIEDKDHIKSERYAIYGHRNHSGVDVEFLPHRIYEGLIEKECFNAKYHMTIDKRQYKKEIDSWAFKYYDDAELILKNIIAFVEWAKKNQTKKIANLTSDLIKPFTPKQNFIEMRASTIGLNVKRRSDLSPFEMEIINEMDFVLQES